MDILTQLTIWPPLPGHSIGIPDEGSLRWIIGMDYMDRKTWRGFDLGLLTAPDKSLVPIFLVQRQ